jgi:hypothetical protein
MRLEETVLQEGLIAVDIIQNRDEIVDDGDCQSILKDDLNEKQSARLLSGPNKSSRMLRSAPRLLLREYQTDIQ